MERQRIAKEAADEAERQRIANEKAAEAERQRIANEKAAEAERLRLAKEKADLAEAQRIAKEAAAEEERIRVAKEAADLAEAERLADTTEDKFGLEAEPDEESNEEPPFIDTSEDEAIREVKEDAIIKDIALQLRNILHELTPLLPLAQKSIYNSAIKDKLMRKPNEKNYQNMVKNINNHYSALYAEITVNVDDILEWQNRAAEGLKKKTVTATSYSIRNILDVITNNVNDRLLMNNRAYKVRSDAEHNFDEKVLSSIHMLEILIAYFSDTNEHYGNPDALKGYDHILHEKRMHSLINPKQIAQPFNYVVITDAVKVVNSPRIAQWHGGKSTRKISRKSSHNVRHTKRAMRRKRATNTHNKRPTFRRNQTRRK